MSIHIPTADLRRECVLAVLPDFGFSLSKTLGAARTAEPRIFVVNIFDARRYRPTIPPSPGTNKSNGGEWAAGGRTRSVATPTMLEKRIRRSGESMFTQCTSSPAAHRPYTPTAQSVTLVQAHVHRPFKCPYMASPSNVHTWPRLQMSIHGLAFKCLNTALAFGHIALEGWCARIRCLGRAESVNLCWFDPDWFPGLIPE